MQLVEQGRADLDGPISTDSSPRLPGAKGPRGLRRGRQGDHPSGEARDHASASPHAYLGVRLRHLERQCLSVHGGERNSRRLRFPACHVLRCAAFIADPGERWEYGISIDWVGRFVEAASGQNLEDYLREHLFAPLGMQDTGFILTPDRRRRLAELHQRDPDGSLHPIDQMMTQTPEFYLGGAGLYGTAGDYVAFIQMMLNAGRSREGLQILCRRRSR